MKDKPELNVWRVGCANREIGTAISDLAYPGFYWLYQEGAVLGWTRWRTRWISNPTPIDSATTRAAIAAIENDLLTHDIRTPSPYEKDVVAFIRSARDYKEEQARSRWERENLDLHEKMLALAIDLRVDLREDLSDEERAEERWLAHLVCDEMLVNCPLRLYDPHVGLSAEEREQHGFAVKAHGPIDVVRDMCFRFVSEFADPDDSPEGEDSLWEKVFVLEDAITWGVFCRVVALVQKV